MIKRPSPHFTWREVDPHGFGMPFQVRVRAVIHAKNLEKFRTEINHRRKLHHLPPTGIHLLSWYRPEWYNHRIGGARFSKHIKGEATDISIQEVSRLMPWKGGRQEFDRVANQIFNKGGFGQYPGGSRHVDSRGYRARWTSF